MDTRPITKEGVAKLREELGSLKNVDRPAVIKAIATAREHGDLKENAEYHEAKKEQGFIEGRIQQLQAILNNCQIVDTANIKANGRVVFGTTVEVLDKDENKVVRFKIVGPDEVDVALGKISVLSPIGRALVGKVVADEVQVETPSGEVVYNVLEVLCI